MTGIGQQNHPLGKQILSQGCLNLAQTNLVSRPARDQGKYQENQTEERKATAGNYQKDLINHDADDEQHDTEYE